MLASYEYPSMGLTFVQCAALVGIALFISWQHGRPGDQWWRSPLVKIMSISGAAVYVFMSWASATG